MKVIGAGLGRTGTLSIKAALEELGFGPCYHQFEVRKNPAHAKIWIDAARGEPVDWRKLFKDYQATVDWPGCAHYKALMEAFPDAKVLLSVRDPDRWYESTLTSIYSLAKTLRDLNAATFATGHRCGRPKSPIWEDMFSGRFEDREYAIEVFNRHNEEVKEYVSADRLLVYEVKDGWEPLCEFLGAEVPEGKPFPRLNNKDALMNLPYARRVRERLEEYQEPWGAEGRWRPAALRSALMPEGLPSKLQALASRVKKQVDGLHVARQLTAARSALERTGTVTKTLIDHKIASLRGPSWWRPAKRKEVPNDEA